MTFLLQLPLEGIKGVLLRDGKVTKHARRRFVVGISDTRWHGTGTSGLLGVGHGNNDEEEGG